MGACLLWLQLEKLKFGGTQLDFGASNNIQNGCLEKIFPKHEHFWHLGHSKKIIACQNYRNRVLLSALAPKAGVWHC